MVDPVSFYANLLAILSVIVSFVAGLIKFVKWMPLYFKRRRLEKNFGSGLFGIDVIKRSTRYYIVCDGTSIDPTRQTKLSGTLAVRHNIFESVYDHLLSEKADAKFLILLADSGMGKTSFILNYWVYNLSLSRRKRHKIYMVPLGRHDATEKINDVQDKQNTVIFLDAFDEDKNAINSHKQRLDELMQACRDFKRVLITCRTQFFAKEEEIPKTTNVMYVGPKEVGQRGKYKFYKLYIAPFTEQQIKQFLKKRFHIWEYRKRKKAEGIVAKIEDLSVRPMLLAFIPYLLEGPMEFKNSYEIYRKMIDGWLERESDWIPKEKLLPFSKLLAFNIYSRKKELEGERIAKAKLFEMAKDSEITIDERKFVHSRSLLNSDGEGNYKFAHRSFMEFLFVEHFLEMDDSLRERFEWTDLMRKFLAEKIKANKYTGKLSFSLCMADLSGQMLCGINLEGTNLKGVNFEGADLQSANFEAVKNFEQIFSLNKTNLKNTKGLSDKQCSLARSKGAITVLQPGDMVLIDKGSILYGEEKQKREIACDYYMDVFPVTNKQYKEFIKAGGYDNREYWTANGWEWKERNNISKPDYLRDQKWNQPDYPVVGVSWYEAVAYCNWLTAIDEEGYVYRLPTEIEWEKAARGNNGREYPWGDKFDKIKCNTSESKLGRTTPVDKYPNGVSPYGCHDMAGNVWEWTKTKYDTKESRDDFLVEEEWKQGPVLRGGSWVSDREVARCADRGDYYPSYRGFGVGFRCVRTKKE